jgi:hypothetical protein
MADTRQTQDRGALWPAKAFRGRLDISGNTFYVSMIATGAAPDQKAPAYNAIIRDQENKSTVVPIWRETRAESTRVGYGEYAGYWISVYQNAHRDADNAPALNLGAQKKEQKPVLQASAPADSQPDLPF